MAADEREEHSMADQLGFEKMLETMQLMGKAWGGLGQMPSGLQPTIDVKEIEKRIADLKAVEQWLNMNLGMLRTTIQALEVQMSTINAMKSMGQSLMPDTISKAVDDTIAQANAGSAAASDAASPMAWWTQMQEQFQELSKSVAKAAQIPAAAKEAKSPTRRRSSSRKKPAA
jgi:hypothetical protein